MTYHRTDMPDVAGYMHDAPQGTLDWVGMSEIAMPLPICDGGHPGHVQASIQMYVDLADSHAKGIHMSRLYRSLGHSLGEEALSPVSMVNLLHDLRETHAETSNSALINLTFDRMLNKPALVSENSGWNRYPVRLRGVLDGDEVHIEQQVVVHYSSTCPASAALSRNVIQQKFAADFGSKGEVDRDEVQAWLGSQQGIVATPHGQRSAATVRVRLNSNAESFPISSLIDLIEETLVTPVQTAVKREDEQEFALRNGQNPMFCEDAARSLKQMLNRESSLLDFLVHVEHFESLHAHNAVCMVAKGVPDGYRAMP